MRRHVFTEDVVIADAQPCWRILVLEVLRCVTDDAAGVKFIMRANRCEAGQIDVRSYDAAGSQLHVFIDGGMGPDLNGGIQLRSRMNNSSGMNHTAASSHAWWMLSQ